MSNLFLKPDEARFLALAVSGLLTDLKETSQDQTINWNPQARKQQKDMIEAGTRLRVKLEKVLGLDMSDLPRFEDGDEKEFLTKES